MYAGLLALHDGSKVTRVSSVWSLKLSLCTTGGNRGPRNQQTSCFIARFGPFVRHYSNSGGSDVALGIRLFHRSAGGRPSRFHGNSHCRCGDRQDPVLSISDFVPRYSGRTSTAPNVERTRRDDVPIDAFARNLLLPRLGGVHEAACSYLGHFWCARSGLPGVYVHNAKESVGRGPHSGHQARAPYGAAPSDPRRAGLDRWCCYSRIGPKELDASKVSELEFRPREDGKGDRG